MITLQDGFGARPRLKILPNMEWKAGNRRAYEVYNTSFGRPETDGDIR